MKPRPDGVRAARLGAYELGGSKLGCLGHREASRGANPDMDRRVTMRREIARRDLGLHYRVLTVIHERGTLARLEQDALHSLLDEGRETVPRLRRRAETKMRGQRSASVSESETRSCERARVNRKRFKYAPFSRSRTYSSLARHEDPKPIIRNAASILEGS